MPHAYAKTKFVVCYGKIAMESKWANLFNPKLVSESTNWFACL